jgi:hypothetical protein
MGISILSALACLPQAPTNFPQKLLPQIENLLPVLEKRLLNPQYQVLIFITMDLPRRNF